MKPWSEVESNPEFQALPEADKSRAQSEYFNDVVAPNLEPQDIEAARGEFFTSFNRSYIPEDSGQGPVESAISTGVQSLAKVGTGTVEGLGQLQQFQMRNLTPVGLAEKVGIPGAQEALDFISTPGRVVEEGAASAQEYVEEAVPSNPLLDDTMLQKGAGVGGQVVGQLGTLVTGAAITRVPKILQILGLGQAGALGLESGYAEADRLGITEPWERDALAASYSAAEVIPERLFGFGTPGFTKAIIGEVQEAMGKGAVKRAAKTTLGEGVEEPITGTLQAAASNLLAEQDPQRPGYAPNGERIQSIDPTTGEFWSSRGEEFVLGALGGSIFAGAEAIATRPNLAQAKQAQEKARLTMEVMAEKPNLTDEDLDDLVVLEKEEAQLRTFIQQQEAKQPVIAAIDNAAVTASQAGLTQSAAALERYKLATAGLALPEPPVLEVQPIAEAPFITPEEEVIAETPIVQPPVQTVDPAVLPERVNLEAVNAPESSLPVPAASVPPAAENALQSLPEAQEQVVANARAVVESQKSILPSAADAWVGTRQEMLADPALRQAWIQNETRIDPSLTEQEASDSFDQFMSNNRLDGLTFAGRTYILADSVEVTKADQNFEGAVKRILRHEDTHIAIEAITNANPKLKKEWEGLKRRVAPEKLDSLAKRRYKKFSNWREDGESFNLLVHEYFAEQMERDEAGLPVDDRPLLEQFIAYMKKVLARVTGRDVSLEEIREFVLAGRVARAREMQAETGGSRASLQEGLPPMPAGEPTFTDWIPIVDKQRAMELAWTPFAVAWQENNPQGTTEQLNAAWAAEIADPESPAIAQGQTEAFMEARQPKSGPAVYSPEPSQTEPETGASPVRASNKSINSPDFYSGGETARFTPAVRKPDMFKVDDALERMLYAQREPQMEVLNTLFNSAKRKGTADQLRVYEKYWQTGDEEYDMSNRFQSPKEAIMFEEISAAFEDGRFPVERLELIYGRDDLGTVSKPSIARFSLKPSYGSQSEERTDDYKEALASIPETGKKYVEFLGKLTRTPKEVQAVRPMVDFARSMLGSYQGDEIEVTSENTERVKELAAQAFQKGKPGAQFAEELGQQFRDSGFSNNGKHQGSVMAGVLQMEILDYAVRLAGTGDKSLALALMPYANDVAAFDHATLSNAGRALQMRSMAGQQKGFWTILNSLAKGERELAEKNPIYKELREALFSDEVKAETAAAVEKDMASTEGQKVLNPTESPEDLLDSYFGRALGIMDQAERDITIKLFTDLAELELLLSKQYEMQAPKGAKASMQAARDMNDPVAIQQRIDELKKSISGGLKALDKFKTSEATKEARAKALNKTPRAKKAVSADAEAKKMLDRLENKERRTKKDAPPWKKAFTEQVKNPKDDAAFGAEMASHGVDAATARKLFDEAAKLTSEAQNRKTEADRRAADRKETQTEVSAAKERVRDQKRDMDRPGRIADQKSFINEVVRQIFAGTLEEQSDPSWRRTVMVQAFKKEGFSQGSAENAADYLGASLDRNLSQAQEKAAQKAAKDLNMKRPTLEKLLRAIRSRAVDPLNTDPVTKALAAEAGFAGITPEQFTELAKLDGQMRGPYQSQRAKAAARMLDIALAAKPPKGKAEILTQAWISSALSSISTMSLSGVHAVFIPVRRFVTDIAGLAMDVSTGKMKPADAAQLMVNTLSNLQQSAKYMLATAKFAGLNDAYTQHIVEFINQMHSMQADLQRAVQTIKDPKATGIEKGKAAIKIAFTSTDIVRRILSTADETWGSMLQDFILRNEAMRVLVQKGRMTPTIAALAFTAASNEGRGAAERHLNETGNEVEAKLIERDATQNALIQAVREAAGEAAAKDVEETASLESPMELGNRRSEDAPLADVFNTGLEWVKQLAIATRRKNELAGRMITGFVTVPANILNRSAYFTPAGIIRALYKMGKFKDMPSFLKWLQTDPDKVKLMYEETMKTEGQQRMRLIEGIVGTMLIAILIALKPDDDEDGLVITGSGPEDRGLREAWLKKGNAPNKIQWVDKKGNVRWSVPYARGGFDHLNLPFTLVGTMDDMRIKGIKPQPANVEWGSQYAHTMLKGLFDQAKFFGLKNVAAMPTQNLTDKSLASQAAYLAAPIMPWSGFTKSLGRMWTGPTDQSSVESAVLAQLPFTNFYASPALNALGDQRGPAPTDAAWDRALMTGVPFTVGAKSKGPDEDLYSFMIDKGVAPNVPLRSNIERKNGLVSDSQWKEYLQFRGKLIKDSMRKNLRELKSLPHQDAQNLMEKISGEATKAAKAKMKLE